MIDNKKRELSQSLEDYLKTIGLLAREGTVRVTDIALNLGVSKPSVVTALKTLESMGLLEHKYYRTITLTKQGEGKEAKIRERYHFLLLFLQEVVEVSPETAKKDACKIEHILSDETFTKMEKLYISSRKKKSIVPVKEENKSDSMRPPEPDRAGCLFTGQGKGDTNLPADHPADRIRRSVRTNASW
jgi:DtxR family Mn-dependent transcriptional regulator